MSVCDYKAPEQSNVESLDLPEGVPPLRAFYLYLSSSCNLACRHCWITPTLVNGKPDPGDVINVAALREAIAEAKPLGLNGVKLTGGELSCIPVSVIYATWLHKKTWSLT